MPIPITYCKPDDNCCQCEYDSSFFDPLVINGIPWCHSFTGRNKFYDYLDTYSPFSRLHIEPNTKVCCGYDACFKEIKPEDQEIVKSAIEAWERAIDYWEP